MCVSVCANALQMLNIVIRYHHKTIAHIRLQMCSFQSYPKLPVVLDDTTEVSCVVVVVFTKHSSGNEEL